MTPVLVDRVRARLLSSGGDATPGRVAAALRDEGLVLGDDAVLDLVRMLRQELIGLGPLDPLVIDPTTTDVLVNAPDSVWVDRGHGLQRTDVRLGSEADVRRLAQRLAATAGRRLDDAAPHVDAQLPGGVRFHAVLAPVAVDSTVISLRVPSRQAFTLEAMVLHGSMDHATAELLRAMVRRRLAILVSGGTGSGKTTLLSALLSTVPHDERIVIVEDSTELAPSHPHVVRLQARLANVEGSGAVSSRDLVRQALRMRPDRLVVGEVRGAEVVDLLAAMNTGHEGGAGTVHANSAEDVPARLEALGLMAGLDRAALHALLGAGVDAVIHLGRVAGTRVISGVHLLAAGDDGVVRTQPALLRRGDALTRGPAMERLRARVDAS